MWCLATSVLPAFLLSSFTSMGLYLFVIALPRQFLGVFFPKHKFLAFKWREISFPYSSDLFPSTLYLEVPAEQTVVWISRASMMLACHLLDKGCLSGFSVTSVLLLLCEPWLRQVISSLPVEKPSLEKTFFWGVNVFKWMFHVLCLLWKLIPNTWILCWVLCDQTQRLSLTPFPRWTCIQLGNTPFPPTFDNTATLCCTHHGLAAVN